MQAWAAGYYERVRAIRGSAVGRYFLEFTPRVWRMPDRKCWYRKY